MIERVAYIAMHSSPLLQPGIGDAGGMNVSLDRLSRTMDSMGVDVTVFSRRTEQEILDIVEVTPGYRVVHIEAGPIERLPISELHSYAYPFAIGVLDWIEKHGKTFDLVHSHYWLSGRAGLRIKNALGIPLANSFHTLGKVKDAMRSDGEVTSTHERLITEAEVIAQSDCLIASTPFEFDDLIEHYDASPERMCVSAPGVDHTVFYRGDRSAAREELGLSDAQIVLFVGRIQAHKGTAMAVEAFVEVVTTRPDGSPPVELHIVGGVSGPQGSEELGRCRDIIKEHGLTDLVRFFEPQPHEVLAHHYRAADVVVVPSRSESFGLVAAEAQACGIPVVASNVGGLAYVVSASESGLLVDRDDPSSFASAIAAVLNHPSFAERLSDGAVEFSKKFSWDATATRFLELYGGITA